MITMVAMETRQQHINFLFEKSLYFLSYVHIIKKLSDIRLRKITGSLLQLVSINEPKV